MKDEKLVVLREWNSVTEAEMAKSILDGAGIFSTIRNEYMSAIYPIGTMPAQLVVKEEDAKLVFVAREKNPLYAYMEPGVYEMLLTTEETHYPIRHTIQIEPNYQKNDSTDVLTLVGNDIRERLQAIVDGKPFNLNYNYVLNTYLCDNPDVVVTVNGDKHNDFYSYCQGLKIIGRKKLIIEEVVAFAAGSNITLLEQQVREFSPKLVCVFKEEAAEALKIKIADTDTKVVSGMEGLVLAHAVVTVRMERMEKMARTVVMPCPRRSLSVITATGLLTV